ncbi:MAG: hypothetical protein RL095_2827 [Verrucomicrobiota bacterium]
MKRLSKLPCFPDGSSGKSGTPPEPASRSASRGLPVLLALLALLSLFSSCVTPAATQEGWDVRILDSGRPGAVLWVVAASSPAGNCAHESLRQLQHRSPEHGCLVLVEKRDVFAQRTAPADWQAMSLAELERRFPSRHTLVLREDFDSWNYTTGAMGDTIVGGGPVAQACLTAISSQAAPTGRKWQLRSSADEQRTLVTTNAKFNSALGMRPSVRQRELRYAVYGAAAALGMCSDWSRKDNLFDERRAGLTRVAVYDDAGATNSTGHPPAWLRDKLALHPGLRVELVGAKEIKSGVLAQVEVLVIGGGNATPQTEALGEEGRQIIRDFVAAGGGYFGICAGACTGAGNFIGPDPKRIYPSLSLIPIRFKGTDLHKDVMLEWKALGGKEHRLEAADLSGGPWFIVPENDPAISIWSRFQSNEEGYPLAGVPAVISARFGKGRVVLTSTHCERQPTDPAFFAKAVRWCDPRSDAEISL